MSYKTIQIEKSTCGCGADLRSLVYNLARCALIDGDYCDIGEVKCPECGKGSMVQTGRICFNVSLDTD